MILYDNVCTPCVRKQQWRDLRRFANKNRLILTRVDIKKSPHMIEEAARYGAEVPFIVHQEKVISLNEPLEKLL